MTMQKILLVTFATLFSFSLVQAQTNESPVIGESSEAVMDEMEKVKRSSFKDTWVHPDADLSRYSKLMFGEAEFEFRDVGDAKAYRSNTRSTSNKGEFGVAESEREKFKDVVGEAFMKQMEKSKQFDIVDQPGPDTILVLGAVVDIVSAVPPEYLGRNEVYMSHVGEATLIIELLDSESGAVLAYAEDRRKINTSGGGSLNHMSMPTNSVTVWSDVRRWANSAASRLRSSLDKAKKKS
jgi:hypothetical protein